MAALSPGGLRARVAVREAAIIPPLMEAERLNAIASKLEDLDKRSAELRRYL
jgi:hypothetical protein